MHALLIGLLVAATAAVLFFAGARVWTRTPGQPSNPSTVTRPAPVKRDDPAKALTGEAFIRSLKRLASESEPKNLDRPSAMCYKVVARPETVSFTCLNDGSRTLYSNSLNNAYAIVMAIEKIRNTVSSIEGLEVTISESEFCRKCYPTINDPKLVLYIKLPGASKKHKIRGATLDDIMLIQEFTSGETIHKSERGEEKPLKDHYPRLQELLGVKADELEKLKPKQAK